MPLHCLNNFRKVPSRSCCAVAQLSIKATIKKTVDIDNIRAI